MDIDKYLTHYWPICSGSMTDKKGSAHMYQGALTTFTSDRFGNPNSALALNGGWTQVPPGVYFNTLGFSISVWVNPSSVGYFSRIIDFGNCKNSDNVFFSLTNGNSLQPYFSILSGSTVFDQAMSSKPITLNQWQFLTVTFNGTRSKMYLNGTYVGETLTHSNTRPFNIWRNNCYIGKSNWAQDEYSNSYLDDLRFYNKSLTQEEILELMNYIRNETSLCFHTHFYCFFKLNKKIIYFY